jgi:hypothetical protein
VDDVIDAGNDEVSGGGKGHGDLCWEPGEGVADLFTLGVPMYHPSRPWGNQVSRSAGFSWATTRMPDGARGMRLKSKVQLK